MAEGAAYIAQKAENAAYISQILSPLSNICRKNAILAKYIPHFATNQPFYLPVRLPCVAGKD